MAAMTAGERSKLIKLTEQRARLAKNAATQRAADLMADVEQQLATEYSFTDDGAFQDAYALAEKSVKDANKKIAARCAELGIPQKFQPRIREYWFPRGENMAKERRAELRKVAQTRIDAMKRRAMVDIEQKSLEVQERLIVDSLESDDAKAFMQSIPTVDRLMPTLSLAESR
jgi:hypothetical protein